jgi:excisionase family DNA binding protein
VSAPATRLTEAQLRALPPVVDVPTAAAALDVAASHVYELIRCGEFPLPVIRLGRTIRIPSGPLLEFLRLTP